MCKSIIISVIIIIYQGQHFLDCFPAEFPPSRPSDEVRLSNFSLTDWQMLATSQKLGREGKVFIFIIITITITILILIIIITIIMSMSRVVSSYLG